MRGEQTCFVYYWDEAFIVPTASTYPILGASESIVCHPRVCLGIGMRAVSLSAQLKAAEDEN